MGQRRPQEKRLNISYEITISTLHCSYISLHISQVSNIDNSAKGMRVLLKIVKKCDLSQKVA